MSGIRKLPVFFHIPKNAGTFILNRLFAYSIAFNQSDEGRSSNKRIHILKNGYIAYRLIVFDINSVCNKNKKFKQLSERVFEIDIEDADKELLDNFYVFSLVVSDISFSNYEKEIFPLMPENVFLYKFISLRDPFSRARSIFNYSNSKKSSHEEIHGIYKDLSLEDYLSSDNVEESWLVKKILGLPDEYDVTQRDFNLACEILDDFDIIEHTDSLNFIENFFDNFYNLRTEDCWAIFDLWCPIYNKTKTKDELTLEDIPKEVKDIFLEKTFWDYKVYKKYTKREHSVNKGKVVNCFYNGSTSGFGDFVRGSVHLYNHCMSKKLDFDINITAHPIRKFFDTEGQVKVPYFMIKDYHSKALQSENFLHVLKKQVDDCLNSTGKGQIQYIFSNLHPCVLSGGNIVNYQNKMPPLTRKCSEWFKKKFAFCNEVNNAADKILNEKKLKKGEFDVLHFRLGDVESYSKEFNKENLLPRYKECLEKSLSYQKENKKPIILMSDSNHFKEYVQNHSDNFIVVHLKSNHTQNAPCGFDGSTNFNDDNLFHTVLDMKILTLARKVESHSIYYHGSGFAFWICKIYNVPFSMNIIK